MGTPVKLSDIYQATYDQLDVDDFIYVVRPGDSPADVVAKMSEMGIGFAPNVYGHVYLSGDQAMTPSSWTTVQFNTVVDDDYSLFDSGNYRFRVPSGQNLGGRYLTIATVRLTSRVAIWYNNMRFINISTTVNAEVQSRGESNGSIQSLTLAAVSKTSLSDGDIIAQAQIIVGGTSCNAGGGAQFSKLQVYRIGS